MEFPLIVKPKNETVSFGVRIVNTEAELREATGVVFEHFNQAVLAERYIEGREINVGLLGNGANLETFPAAELIFGDGAEYLHARGQAAQFRTRGACQLSSEHR